jgi:hypothetical protein
MLRLFLRSRGQFWGALILTLATPAVETIFFLDNDSAFKKPRDPPKG